jgi:hypothetical protein
LINELYASRSMFPITPRFNIFDHVLAGSVRDPKLTVSQVPVATLILSSPPNLNTLASSVTSRNNLNLSNGVNVGTIGFSAVGEGECIIVRSNCSLAVIA